MRVKDLLFGFVKEDLSMFNIEVSGIQDDSRQVCPGELFFAIKGLKVDGHDYAQKAVEKGAVAVIAEQGLKLSVPCFVVDNPRRVLGVVASRLYGEPCKALKMIGVTGTNGKTTITYLIESILKEAMAKPGVIGTVSYRFGGSEIPSLFTTPTPILLQKILQQMVTAKCDHGILEVSSHALELGRVWGCGFDVAAFTHLTQDHLDLHQTMEKYLQAKLLLFSNHLNVGGTAVVNLDGNGSDRVIQTVKQRKDLTLVSCSTCDDKNAKVYFTNVNSTVDGVRAILKAGGKEIEIRSPLVGMYNAENILVAAACCLSAHVDLPTIAKGIEKLKVIPGRLERVGDNNEKVVFVDYAHTPDALERVLSVLKPLCKGQLIVVFGCGGDRDRSKRPLMGRSVANAADIAIVTSDNPRSESAKKIIEDILQGINSEGFMEINTLGNNRGYLVEEDRGLAITKAVDIARSKDIVLIAGKGHEDYQIIGNTRLHFDDREEVRKAGKK